MAAVRHVGAVGDSLDDAVFLPVRALELTGCALRRRAECRPVAVLRLGVGIRARAHVSDDLEAELLRRLALAVMLARERDEAFRETAEADGIGSMLEHVLDRVRRLELFRAHPDALPHEERVVVDMLLLDDVQALEQVVMAERDVVVVELEEFLHVALCLDRELRQVDRREGEVAARAGLLRAVDIAHHARAAAHRRDAAVVVARLIVLEIVRRVDVDEVREEALRARLARLQEEVVVRIARVVVHARLELEDGNREDRRLAVAEARPDGVERLARREASLRARVHAVIDRRERHLRARAAVKRVEIVDERLHRLVCLLLDVSAGEAVDAARVEVGVARRLAVLRENRGERAAERLDAALAALRVHLFRVEAGVHVHRREELRLERLLRQERFLLEPVNDGFARLINDRLAERLAHALRHRVVERVDALSAEHVVLVALDGDAGEARVSADGIRLTQEAVPRREAAVEELQEIDLAAVERDEREILVVDMDVVLLIRRREALVEHVVIDEVLRALGAELEHDAHRGVGVDIRVVALEVGVLRRRKEDVLIRLHEVLLRLAPLRVALAVHDVALRDVVEVVLHELLLDHVLDLLDAHVLAVLKIPLDLARDLVDVLFRHLLLAILIGPTDGIVDLLTVVGDREPRALRYCLQHHRTPLNGGRSPPFSQHIVV